MPTTDSDNLFEKELIPLDSEEEIDFLEMALEDDVISPEELRNLF